MAGGRVVAVCIVHTLCKAIGHVHIKELLSRHSVSGVPQCVSHGGIHVPLVVNIAFHLNGDKQVMLSQPAAVIIVVIPYHQIAVVGFAALSGQDHLTVPLFHRYQREVSAEDVIPARNSIGLHVIVEIAVQEVLHQVCAARFPDQRTRASYRTGRCVRTNIDIQAVIETETIALFYRIESLPLL